MTEILNNSNAVILLVRAVFYSSAKMATDYLSQEFIMVTNFESPHPYSQEFMI